MKDITAILGALIVGAFVAASIAAPIVMFFAAVKFLLAR
jgi:hypothetical protein